MFKNRPVKRQIATPPMMETVSVFNVFKIFHLLDVG
jgi:hypothetical protein